MSRAQRPDSQVVQGQLDEFLRYALRSICTLLAGEDAGGTLWLRDGPGDFHRIHLALLNGVVSSGTEAGYGCECIPLAPCELPRSGAPRCCSGYGADRWISRGLRGFVSLPMMVADRQIGCFIAHLKPADADPPPSAIELAEFMARLATQALDIGGRRSRES